MVGLLYWPLKSVMIMSSKEVKIGYLGLFVFLIGGHSYLHCYLVLPV